MHQTWILFHAEFKIRKQSSVTINSDKQSEFYAKTDNKTKEKTQAIQGFFPIRSIGLLPHCRWSLYWQVSIIIGNWTRVAAWTDGHLLGCISSCCLRFGVTLVFMQASYSNITKQWQEKEFELFIAILNNTYGLLLLAIRAMPSGLNSVAMVSRWHLPQWILTAVSKWMLTWEQDFFVSSGCIHHQDFMFSVNAESCNWFVEKPNMCFLGVMVPIDDCKQLGPI